MADQRRGYSVVPPKMLAQAFRSEPLSHHSPFSVDVAASRLACADTTERPLYASRLWMLTDDLNPRASLYDLALRLHARCAYVPVALLPELSMLVDAALASCVWIDADPARNTVEAIYTGGAAPARRSPSRMRCTDRDLVLRRHGARAD